MACNDSGYQSSGYSQEYVDNLTDMLCTLCERVDGCGSKMSSQIMPAKISKWWDKHQAADDERIAREEAAKLIKDLAKSAKSKLTKEERKALKTHFHEVMGDVSI